MVRGPGETIDHASGHGIPRHVLRRESGRRAVTPPRPGRPGRERHQAVFFRTVS
ncbi:hypothetical protein HMPREF9154_2355 [Arachnia propionica F0230a]|nr:hypothetical protein HMPREF9154_2355 [Arachnia propionica F0230a]